MSLPKELTVNAWAPAIEGCGSQLEITCQAIQTTKAGRTHRTKLRLKVDRYLIRQLAEQIAKMQQRDLERLAQEKDRLQHEIAPITRPASGAG